MGQSNEGGMFAFRYVKENEVNPTRWWMWLEYSCMRMQEKETLVLYVYITEKDGDCVKKAEEEVGKKTGAKPTL